MPDGYSVCIEHVEVVKSKETLGVHTCPLGKNRGALESMQDKAQVWVAKARNGKVTKKITLVPARQTVLAEDEVWLVRQ